MRLHLLTALLLLTATATAQWQLQDAHTTADLRGIHSLGNGVAWASGTNGTVLRTEDAGFVWQLCAIPPNAEHLDFRAIQAFDNNTAIVMSSGKGDLSRLYKTTDGCQTWTLLFTNPDKDGFWDALRFTRFGYGALLGDPVQGAFWLAFTSDGGKHWSRQTNIDLEARSSEQGAFAASNSSILSCFRGPFAFGSGGTGGAAVYVQRLTESCGDGCTDEQRNLDGHKDTWSRSLLPMGDHNEGSGVFSLDFKDEARWIAIGGNYLKPNESSGTAAFTVDGGLHWLPALTSPHGYRSAVAYDPKTNTWITVGPNGTDISTDDGRNWGPLHPNPAAGDPPDADQHWNALSLPFVVGPHGRIATLHPDALPTTAKKP